MKFRIPFLLVFLSLWCTIQAYTQSTLYDQLDTALIPSTILRDKAPKIIPWNHFTGMNPDTISHQIAFKQLFYEVEQAELAELLPELKDLWLSALDWQREDQSIPLIMLDISYAQILNNAEENGLIGFDNGYYFDIPSETSPYTQRPLFAAFPVSEYFPESGTDLYVGPEFYFTNNNTVPSEVSLQIDGLETVAPMGSTISLPNLQDKTISVQKTSGQTSQITYFNWKLATCEAPFDPDPTPWPIGDLNFPWLIQTEFNGEVIEGNAYVKYHYGQETPELDRVFVFVEGIDFNSSHTITEQRFGDFGWCQFTSGNAEGYEFLFNSPVLIDYLRNEGYDIILLDFKDGADYIQNNAALLQTLLNRINEYKIGKAPITLAGASMGGQITRYALSSMEQAGETHCVDFWVSLDSPHKGANIPLGFQEMLQSLANNPNSEYAEIEDQLANSINRPAARQMLIHQRAGYSLFNDYYTELENLGWPSEVVSYGIANGSGEAIDLNIEDEHLFLFGVNDPLLNQTAAWMKCMPAPGDENGLISSVNMPSEYLDLGLPCSDVPINYSGNDMFYSFDQEIDDCPGSKRPTIEDFTEDLIISLQQNPCASMPDQFAHIPHHTFIPTVSALAVSTTDLYAHVENELEEGLSHTPFSLFRTAENDNEQHSIISDLALADMIRYRGRDGMLAEELTGSDPNNGLYNMNLIYRSSLTDLTVHSGGSLYLNTDLPAEYGLDPDIPDNCFTDHLTVRTNQCGAYIELGNDGYMQVGSGEENLTAALEIRGGSTLKVAAGGHLTIGKGSSMVIRSGAELVVEGGKLEVEDNARLIIEEGALFQFDNGSQLQLLGAEAVVELSGHLHIGANTTFSIQHPDGSSGKIRIRSNDEWITGGPGSRIELWGDYLGDQIIEVMEGAALLVNESVSEFEISSGRINLHSESLVNIATDMQAINMQIDGADATTISVWKGALFRDCELNDLDLLAFQAEDVLRVERTMLDHVKVNVEGTGYRVYDSFFNSSNISSEQLSVNSRIVDCAFDGNNVIHTGIDEKSMITLHVKNTAVTGYETGISKTLGELKLQCSEVNTCNIGVAAEEYTTLNLSKPLGGGGNLFNDNDIHVKLFYAADLLLQHGNNDFDGATDWALYGTLVGTCDEFCSSLISATGNVWNTFGANSPSNAGVSLIKIDPLCDYSTPMTPESGCEVLVQDKLPIGQRNCLNGWINSGNEKPVSETSAGLEPGDPPAIQDPFINTIHYSNIALSKALYDATNHLTAHNTETGDDVMAIGLLHEILSADLDRSIPHVRQLSSAGVFLLRTGVEDIWLHSDPPIQGDNSFTPATARLVDILNAYTLNEVSQEVYNDQFCIELHKSHVLGISNVWPTAITMMKEVDDCGLDSLEQSILNKEIQNAAYQAFLQELPPACQHPDSMYLHNPIQDVEDPQTYNTDIYGFGAWLESPTTYSVSPCPNWQPLSQSVSNNSIFEYYPNPANGEIYVRFNIDEVLPVELVFYNVMGQMVKRIQPVALNQLIELQDLSTGSYVIRAVWQDGTYSNEKFQIYR